ncbi:Serine protease inhibitor- potato inhibitor I-type family protein [Salvia divinorum]|uniref:Serine protease inhibitor- potato inhibitor I-type family protein n=1 Tax=Salvia divinorum TaxID=28513 RepID=A0ABD1GSU5_SALDI
MQSSVDQLICRGKTSWPELLMKNGEEAAVVIESENPFVRAMVIKEGTPVSYIFSCNRVLVVVNECGNVISIPVVG